MTYPKGTQFFCLKCKKVQYELLSDKNAGEVMYARDFKGLNGVVIGYDPPVCCGLRVWPDRSHMLLVPQVVWLVYTNPQPKHCTCDFSGANCWLGCRCGAFLKECA